MSSAPDSSSGPLDRRRAGVLLHPTSLPAGDLGAQAHDFVDFLAAAGATVAGRRCRWCRHTRATARRTTPCPRWPATPPLISTQLRAAYGMEREEQLSTEQRTQYDVWCTQQADWLEAYVEFTVLRDLHGGEPWQQWEPALRDRDPAAVAAVLADHDERVRALRLAQWVFDEQWRALRTHAASRGVSIVGDIPVFVAHDSADVWANRACSSSTTTAGRPSWPACRPTTSATRPALGQSALRLGGMARTATAGGSPLFRHCSSWSTWCGSTTFAALRRPGKCRRAGDGRGRRVGQGPGGRCSSAMQGLWAAAAIAEDLGLITAEVGRCATTRLPGHESAAVRLRRRPGQPLPARTIRRRIVSSTPARTTTTPPAAGFFRARLGPANRRTPGVTWATDGSHIATDTHAAGAALDGPHRGGGRCRMCSISAARRA